MLGVGLPGVRTIAKQALVTVVVIFALGWAKRAGVPGVSAVIG